MRECSICGQQFTPKNRFQKVCSFKCRMESNRLRGGSGRFPLVKIVCRFCKESFMPTTYSQRYHPICKEIANLSEGLLQYYHVCSDCGNEFLEFIFKIKHVFIHSTPNPIDIFYNYKDWCEICRRKISENRYQKKPNQAEKFIYDCLKKHFPKDDIVLLDRKQIRYANHWWEIDIYDRTNKFGFEYDDPGHLLKVNMERDLIKQKLCEERNIKLIRVKYTELLTEQLILSKLRDSGVLTKE